MCFGPFATIATALKTASAASATAAVPTAVTAIGAPLGPAMSLASGASAVSTAQLTTALSSAAWISSAVGNLAGFAANVKMAKAMGEAAHKQWQAEQAQLGERARQEKLKSEIEHDQLARNAAVGIAKTKTMGTAQGLAGLDERVIDFAIQAEQAAGIDREVLDMKMASLNEAAGQSTQRFQTALDQARSATSPEAFLGLGMNLAGGFFDSYRMFGALPFEDPAKYSKRITGIA